jgi:glycosyltransferase involved in cell wall biosynthesis
VNATDNSRTLALSHSRTAFIAAHNGARIWGGAERATAALLAGLQRRGHRVLLFCNDPLVAEGASALGVPTELQPLGGDGALHHAVRFALRLRRDRPDALVVGTYKKLLLAGLAARLARVPKVAARVGLESDTPRNAKYRIALPRLVDTVVVNADRMRSAFADLRGLDSCRVVTIHNGVHPPTMTSTREEVRRSLGIPPDAPVVGAVARLAGQKRFDRLLRAVSRLSDDVHCVLAGDGSERAALESLARELRIAPRVHFLGHRDDVGNVLGALDVFAVTSDREGMSNAMLEALAAGVPVASTPVSGADEALAPLPDGRAVGIVTSFDEEGIASALRDLLADRGRLAAMGAAAREAAEERFGFERMLDRWERVLLGAG